VRTGHVANASMVVVAAVVAVVSSVLTVLLLRRWPGAALRGRQRDAGASDAERHDVTQDPPEERRQSLLEEYKEVGEYHRAEGNVFWQRHGQYLAVNTGLLAALALAKPEGAGSATLVAGVIPPTLFVKGVCIIGLVASFAWLITTATGGWTALMWADMMRRIECEANLPTKFMHAAVPRHSRWLLLLRFMTSIRVWSHALPIGYGFLWGYGLWWIFHDC